MENWFMAVFQFATGEHRVNPIMKEAGKSLLVGWLSLAIVIDCY